MCDPKLWAYFWVYKKMLLGHVACLKTKPSLLIQHTQGHKQLGFVLAGPVALPRRKPVSINVPRVKAPLLHLWFVGSRRTCRRTRSTSARWRGRVSSPTWSWTRRFSRACWTCPPGWPSTAWNATRPPSGWGTQSYWQFGNLGKWEYWSNSIVFTVNVKLLAADDNIILA